MNTEQFALNGTPQKVFETGPASAWIYVHADDNGVYLGASTVTSTTGLTVDKNTVIELFVDQNETLWAATSTPGAKLIILKPSNS